MTTLNSRLTRPNALLAPGIYDGLSALLVAQAGFEAAYLSGASIAYTQLGQPDIGLLGLKDIADTVTRIRERTALPLIVDADTGFGNALNVQRTVDVLERAGASAIQIEDQAMPKRCGHLAGKEVIAAIDMAGKVKAAVDARRSTETLIIARTDSLAVEGIERAVERAHLYFDAGADILFVEAPATIEQMERIVRELGQRGPLLANMVEGGRTPIRSVSELEQIGFKLVITPGALVRALTFTAQEFLASLRATGSTAAFKEKMLAFDQLQEILGLPGLLERGAYYEGTRKKAAE